MVVNIEDLNEIIIGRVEPHIYAFSINTIILSENSVDLYNEKVIRSTQGMIFNMNIISADIVSSIKSIKKNKIFRSSIR